MSNKLLSARTASMRNYFGCCEDPPRQFHLNLHPPTTTHCPIALYGCTSLSSVFKELQFSVHRSSLQGILMGSPGMREIRGWQLLGGFSYMLKCLTQEKEKFGDSSCPVWVCVGLLLQLKCYFKL